MILSRADLMFSMPQMHRSRGSTPSSSDIFFIIISHIRRICKKPRALLHVLGGHSPPHGVRRPIGPRPPW